MNEPIYSLSISGRLTLDLHSLNNEGGEGNQTLTRQVTIVVSDVNSNPRLATVNAISGDMIKHIQAEHLQRICADQKLPLCIGCNTFNANRVNIDRAFLDSLEKSKGSDVVDRLLKHCALDDMLGVLITEGNRSAPRKSVAEYGWVVALPDLVSTDSFFHVKYDPSRRSTQEATHEAEGSNTGQAIFHRPASSGVYAVVANFELWRIGFNDISRQYVVDEAGRSKRTQALLKSVLFTFLQPNGAQRNTQNPHIVNFEGVLSITTRPLPAPTVSALNDNYSQQIKGIVAALEPLCGKKAVYTEEFDSLQTFAELLSKLAQIKRIPRNTVKRPCG